MTITVTATLASSSTSPADSNNQQHDATTTSVPDMFAASSLAASYQPHSILSLSFDITSNDTTFDVTMCSAWKKKMVPNGTVSLSVLTGYSSSDDISSSFLLAGLILESEKKMAGRHTFVGRAKKLEQKFKAASIFAKKDRSIGEEEKKDTVKIDLDMGVFGNDNNDDDDAVDEDDLLAQSSLPSMPISASNAQEDDCGGRKACDNCSCGRKEREEAAARGEVSQESLKQAPTSACGNCSKGDAFRCASCPYLGKPAFREGEEHLVLDLMDDI